MQEQSVQEEGLDDEPFFLQPFTDQDETTKQPVTQRPRQSKSKQKQRNVVYNHVAGGKQGKSQPQHFVIPMVGESLRKGNPAHVASASSLGKRSSSVGHGRYGNSQPRNTDRAKKTRKKF